MVHTKRLHNKRRILKLFLQYSAAYIVFMLAIAIVIFQLVQKNVKTNLNRNELSLISDLDVLIQEVVNQVNSDVNFLAKQTELFYANDEHEFIRHLEETFLEYTNSKKIYDQIRFIDINGEEKVRVNYRNNKPSIVAEKQLQNKKDRYYFSAILNTPADSIYFSPFDLNVENGVIEKPLKPMIRMGKTICNKENTPIGIIVANLLGQVVIDPINKIDPNSNSSIFFTNTNGYYFKCPNPDEEWGFMFNEETHNLNFSFPEESKQIYNSQSGSFFSDKGYFSYNTVYPIRPIKTTTKIETRFWKIIAFTPNRLIEEYIDKEYSLWINILIISIIPVIILFWFLARNIEFKIQARLSLIKTNKELQELNKTKDKFFSILAHDLRNPFGAILGFSNLLVNQTNLSIDEYEKIGKSINKSANNAFELLENLLTWALTQKGSIKYAPEHIVLYDIGNNTINLLRENAAAKNIAINNFIDPTVTVMADIEMLKTILRNLISNAIKFTNKNGTIKIGTEPDSSLNFISINVTDNGVGIAQDDLDRFFKLDNAITTKGTAKETGSGLGLILCKEFVEKNGGTIRIESEVNKGSSFIFTLPLA